MHRLRDNNSTEHFVRALAELPCGAGGSIVAYRLPDLRTLTELPHAQNRKVTKADFLTPFGPMKIEPLDRGKGLSTVG
jgi:hypothetical protein